MGLHKLVERDCSVDSLVMIGADCTTHIWHALQFGLDHQDQEAEVICGTLRMLQFDQSLVKCVPCSRKVTIIVCKPTEKQNTGS